MKKLLMIIGMFAVGSVLYAYDVEQATRNMQRASQIVNSNPRQASAYIKQAIKMLSETGEDELRLNLLILYSRAENYLGNFDTSIRTLYDALPLVKKEDLSTQALLYWEIGHVYMKLLDYNRSIEYIDKSTNIYKSLGDSVGIARCYNSRGLVHCQKGEYAAADRFLEMALAINRNLRDLKSIATTLNNFCLYEGKDTPAKIEMIKEAITINKNLNNNWSLGENYNNLAKQYFYNKDYKGALAALHTGRKYAEETGSRELLCDYYEYSSMVHAAMHNYEMAYHFLDSMSMLNNDLRSNTQLRNMENAIAEKKMARQNFLVKQQEQEYKIRILNRNLLLLTSLLVVTIAFFIFWYKRKRHQKDMELMQAKMQVGEYEKEVSELKVRQQEMKLVNIQDALDKSKHEVINFAMLLRSRNELLEKIRGMVRAGYKLDQQEMSSHLKKISQFIGQYQSNDRFANELMLSIEEKNNEFLQRLLEKHPGLTPGEKHLATLIRIELSTKEISLLTGTTPKTVTMNRYRLRRSLALEGEVDLAAYLRAI